MFTANALVPAFALPGQWFRGSLHVHSTASDGQRTPDEVLAWYRERGYHFVALTDHRVWAESRPLAEGFITLGGIEVDGIDLRSGLFHLVGLGLRQPPDLGGAAGASLPQTIDQLREAGGLAVLAHPYWSGQRSGDLLALAGCIGLEVYNGGCEVDDAKGFSAIHWDDLLAAGHRLWGLAVDDAHWRDGDYDAGLGWVWVKAAELTETAILDALEQGFFYASSGPKIHSLKLEGGLLRVRCSPVVSVDFVGSGHQSRRISAPPGETLAEASCRVWPAQRYVRVVCRDVRGGCAWSNPIFLE
jgi:predicted metal-dependent phosphoesterase TrpH